MTHKRRKLNESIGCPTISKKSKILATDQPSTSCSFSKAITSQETAQGLRKTNHGVIFQLKLLMLFLIRGIEAGYMFQLGTEMEDIGGKFDDLIFKYQVKDNSPAGKHDRYRYLQAKHKQNESFKITSAQLLNDKEGDFSLLKYFRSYCDIMSRGDDIEDCIICTNVGFSTENLKKNGIELVTFNTRDTMFSFDKHSFNHYKIKIKSNHKLHTILQTIQFNDPVTKTLKNVTCEEIEAFFDKLVFVANTPNEVDLGGILTDEVGKYYNVKEADFQSDFILRNMLDWFKKKESKFMTSKEGIEIFRKGKVKMKSLRRTSVSIHYQRQLRQVLEFNRDAIHEMAKKLKTLLIAPKKIEHIWTRLPKRTAIKVIEALKELRLKISRHKTDAVAPEEPYVQRKDSYLMTSFRELKKDREKFKALFKADLSHNLLVVVCEGDASMEKDIYYEKLVKNPNKKVIIIGQGDAVEETKDDLKFKDLSAQFKRIMLSKEILFQGTYLTVGNLMRINGQTIDDLIESEIPEKVINLNVIEELIKKEKLKIASFTSSRFEKSLYIRRKLTSAFPFDIRFWSEVAVGLGYSIELLESKVRISSKGEIEWFVTGEEKTKIWEKIIVILEKRKSLAHLPSKTVEEDDLMKNKKPMDKKADVVVVSGVAGSGKSSILSHYYDMIKDNKPDHWVIIISLTDNSEAFLKLKSTVVNKSSVTDFLLNLAISDKSPFACSLLRHRLSTGDRFVVMLDGFDESHYQETVIEIIKVFREMKLNGIYVTTRSHMTSQIQFELSQLTYSLNNFSKQDQIKYLTSIWKREFHDNNVEKDLWRIAESLVDRVSDNLKDEERAFIGVPLQCRILAECFQSELQKSFQQNKTFDSFLKTIDCLNLSLANIYRLLMEKKHEIYRLEKKAQSCTSDLASSHAKEDIDNLEPFLRKLAIKTIVSFKEHVDVLLGKKISMTPKEVLAKKNKKRMDHCSRFGLLDRNAKGEVRFLHRTYAEYLMAEYLYTGFLLDDEKRNHLLDYESARKLIISKIWVNNQYDGVQIFFDSMLKEMVDDDKEWRKRIILRKLPDGVHNLSQTLFTRIVHLKINENPLQLSVANKREKIFKFLCDVLDATFDKLKVLQTIQSSFPRRYSFKNFCSLNSEVFLRYVDYFDNVPITNNEISSSKEKNHVQAVMEGLFGDCKDDFPPCGLKYSYWDGEEKQKMLHRLLQFMDKHRHIFNEIIPGQEYAIGTMLAMFIFNKNYDSHLKLFINLLSQSDLYSDDFAFANFINDVFISVKRKHRLDSDRFKKVLTILKELNGRHGLLDQIFGKVVKIEPKALKSLYKPCQLLEEDVKGLLPVDLHLLLERDSFRISCFHREANYKSVTQNELVEKALAADWNPDMNQTVNENVDYYDFITPFYVAAIWSHEKICCNLLAFLKRHLPEDIFKKGLVNINGFVHRPLSDAIASENFEMYKIILKTVKQTLGQGYLIALLKSTIQEKLSTKSKTWMNDWTDTSMFTVGCKYKLFQTIAEIVLEKDNVTGKTNLHENLNDLIFDDLEGLELALKSVDVTTFQGMMSFKGSVDWTKRLLDLNLYNGFPLLVSYCLHFFSQDQLSQLTTTLTRTFKNRNSYWGRLCLVASVDNQKEGFGDLGILKFLKFLSEKLGETILIQFLLHDEGNRSVENYIFSQALVNILSNNLSKEGHLKVSQHWKTNVPLMIQEHFFNPTSENYSQILNPENWKDMIQIYLDYANVDQLRKFVNFITDDVRQEICGEEHSIWSFIYRFKEVEESNEILKRVLEKPLTFGQDAVKTLLCHEFNNVPLILLAASEENVDDRLVGLPNNIRDEIQNYIAEHSSQLIENCFSNPITYWGIYHYLNLNKFIYAFNYCNSNQLQQFEKNFTSLQDEADSCRKKRSIWGKIFAEPFKTDESIQIMHKFLKRVSDKFGQNEVMRLILHEDGFIICSKAREDQENFIEAMLSYLDAKNRKMVQRKIDDYVAENLKDASAAAAGTNT